MIAADNTSCAKPVLYALLNIASASVRGLRTIDTLQ
jgi:hypothetical protein